MADVLVVEDDDDVALLMQVFLERDGHEVRWAPDGEKGLACLADRFPDVVVMDVEMPLLSGPGMAARMLVQNCGRQYIPIVLVSGAFDVPGIAENIGTPYFVAKPFAPTHLLEMVSRAVVERRPPRPPFYDSPASGR